MSALTEAEAIVAASERELTIRELFAVSLEALLIAHISFWLAVRRWLR
jgi:hypothetical protein